MSKELSPYQFNMEHVENIEQARFSPESIAVALAAGMDPNQGTQLLLARAGNDQDQRFRIAQHVVAGYRVHYGSIKAFPEGVFKAFHAWERPALQVLIAAQAEERLAGAIAGALESADSSDAAVVPASRRRTSL